MNFWKLMARTPYWRGKGRLALAVLRRTRGSPVLGYTPSGGRVWLAWDSATFLMLPYLIGKYEAAVRKVIAAEYPRLVAGGLTFVDVGANVGFYTADALGAGVKVTAIEPNPDAFVKLRENVDLARGLSVVLPWAVSDRARPAYLHCSRRTLTAGSLAAMPGLSDDRPVTVVTLDAVAPGPVGLIKLDIEGGEYDALRGARRILDNDSPVVVYEENNEFCLAFGHQPGEAQRFLEGLGYVVSVIDVDRQTGTRNMAARRVR